MKVSGETLRNTAETVDNRAVRKAFLRLVPWCIVFYVLSYMDRVNAGFAALTMNADLGLTAQMFGFAGTGFYIAYTVFQVPSNIALAKFGARIWIPVIMVIWGSASIATMFATGPYSFYFFRAVLGAVEAGLMPGIMYYLGQWFPKEHRARANGLFLMSLPLALFLGGPLSGSILEMDGWLGLKGWQWLFLLEGLPPVLVGLCVYFFLPNGPDDASWLDDAEKLALRRRLETDFEDHPEQAAGNGSFWKQIANPTVAIFGATYFCMLTTITTFSVWTPLIVKEVLGDTDRVLLVSVLSAVPPLVTIIVMQFVSYHSDRSGERAKYLIGCMAVAAIGWVMLGASSLPVLKFLGLVICFAGGYSALPIFWAAASLSIPRAKQAVVIAAIGTIGSFASIISPGVIGFLHDLTQSFGSSAFYGAALMVVGIVALLRVSISVRPVSGAL